MTSIVARAPFVSGLITTRSDGENRKSSPVVSANELQSGNQLKQSKRATGFLHCFPLFAVHLHSNVRKKCGRLVTVCGAKDMLFNQRSSSSLQGGADKLTDAVGVAARPRGPSQFMNQETLRWTHVVHRPERGSSVRTNAGRNKKWRTLEKGRLEGNKRTRSSGNAGKPKPPRPDGAVQGPQNGVNADGTERPVKEPRVKPKKGPKPKERVSWAGQKMLLLNMGDRSKVGDDVQPWASVRTERMPDDYYKYGPFGPHAWKGVTVGTPRKGTLCDKLVVFFSTVENEEEHELGDIQDAITGYAQRVDQMDDESVGVQYYFAFARQIVRVPGLSPWEDWTLVAQVAVESGEELDKVRLGSKLDRKMWEVLSRCVAWYRPDLIYVKRPAYEVRFEPQKEFLEGWVTLLDPKNGSHSYYQRLCKLLGVDENEDAEQVGIIFDGLSEDRKMECVEHVLTDHPVFLLKPITRQDLKAEQQQKSASGMNNVTQNEIESIESADDEGDDSADDTNEDEPEEDFEAFNGQFGEEFDFDEQALDDSQSSRSEWEIEEAKALAAEAMQDSPNVETLDADEEALKAYSEIGMKSQGQRIVEETETEEHEPFLYAALRPFSYTNLINEIFIIRRALVDLAELERSM